MRLKVFLLDVRRIVVDAGNAVFPISVGADKTINVKMTAKTTISIRITQIFIFIPSQEPDLFQFPALYRFPALLM